MTDQYEPLVTIGPMDRVLAVWFLGFQGVDWMCTVWRTEDGSFRAVYRFRYQVDSKIFDSDDRKSSYSVRADAGTDIQRVLGTLQFLHDFIAKTSPFGEPECDDTFMRPDGATVGELASWMNSKSWCHSKSVTMSGNA